VTLESEGMTEVEVTVHNSIIGDFIVDQDRFLTNLLQCSGATATTCAARLSIPSPIARKLSGVFFSSVRKSAGEPHLFTLVEMRGTARWFEYCVVRKSLRSSTVRAATPG